MRKQIFTQENFVASHSLDMRTTSDLLVFIVPVQGKEKISTQISHETCTFVENELVFSNKLKIL